MLSSRHGCSPTLRSRSSDSTLLPERRERPSASSSDASRTSLLKMRERGVACNSPLVRNRKNRIIDAPPNPDVTYVPLPCRRSSKPSDTSNESAWRMVPSATPQVLARRASGGMASPGAHSPCRIRVRNVPASHPYLLWPGRGVSVAVSVMWDMS